MYGERTGRQGLSSTEGVASPLIPPHIPVWVAFLDPEPFGSHLLNPRVPLAKAHSQCKESPQDCPKEKGVGHPLRTAPISILLVSVSP